MTKSTPTPAIDPLPDFAGRLLAWHARHGRHDLPWQQQRTPYRVWLSEIMLQQTRLATALPYFERFTQALPNLESLAQAPLDQVLALWSGLGYYSRARNLHAAARRCSHEHGGELPDRLEALIDLPGIGRSTAGAILAQAWGRPAAILDGNVKRLLCRSHGVDGYPGNPAVANQLWQLSETLLPDHHLPAYTQASMDMGALVCTRANPDCPSCPLRGDCRALAAERVAELPVPRPNRKLPERHMHWLVLLDPHQRVLLQRRPPRGIWGGLWSLPEYADRTQLDTALAMEFKGRVEQVQKLSPIRHIFSHFALTAQPLQLQLPSHRTVVADGDHQRWLLRSELPDLGIPQPVRRLLTTSVLPQ